MTTTLAITGKSGSGKTTITKAFLRIFQEYFPDKSILLFDNDLASELGHSFGRDIRNTIYGIRSGKHEYKTGIPEDMTKQEYIELALSIPIWGKLQGQSRVAKKRNAMTKASAEYDQKKREVESEVRRAIQDRDGAEAAYLQANRRCAVQEEAYNLNLKKLEQGLISSLEFQTANNNYLKANADQMNSLFKYLIKKAIVNYYGGTPYLNQ